MEPVRHSGIVTHETLAGSLRRALQRPFEAMERIIRECDLNDTKTEEIRDWLHSFQADLRGALDEQVVYNRYIKLLHDILCDPFFPQAPLEPPAVYGTGDGVTYGLKALIVVMAAFPEDEQHLSLQNGQPLTLVEHPVVNHMINWLEERGQPLGFSSQLDSAYRDLLSQPPLLQRMDHLRRLHLEFEIARQAEQTREVERFEARLARMHDEREAEMRAVAARVVQLAEPFQQLIEEAQELRQEARAANTRLDQELQRTVNEGFSELTQRVRDHETQNTAELSRIAEERRIQCLRVDEAENSLAARVARIQAQNAQLEAEQRQMQQNLNEVDACVQQLDRNIQVLHETITRNNKRQNVLRDIGCAVLSIAVTVGLQYLAPGTSINLSRNDFSASTFKAL